MRNFVTAGKVKEIKSSITMPENAGLRMILNFCSVSGKYTGTVSEILTKRWKRAQDEYKNWFVNRVGFKLGEQQPVAVQSDIWVLNMICFDEKGELDQKAFTANIEKARKLAQYEKGSVHVSTASVAQIPGLKEILVKEFSENGVHIYFYQEA